MEKNKIAESQREQEIVGQEEELSGAMENRAWIVGIMVQWVYGKPDSGSEDRNTQTS